MRPRRRILAAVLAAVPACAAALDFTAGSGAAIGCSGPTGVRLHAAAVAWLEPAPISRIDDYGGPDYAPREGANAGIGVGFAELSAGSRGYCVGVLYREELVGAASLDLLDILHADHFGNPFTEGRRYEARLERAELAARGVRLRRVFEFSTAAVRTRIGIGASLLQAERGLQESVNGAVTASSDHYASGTATWSLADSDLDPKQFNPFVGAGNPKGWGYSTDLHLHALIRERTEVELVVMDAYGRIHWDDMRSSRRVLDNEVIRVDENANHVAMINGVDRRIEADWRIRPKYHFALSHQLTPGLKLLANDDSVRGLHFVSFGAQLGSDFRHAGILFDARTSAVSLTARSGAFALSLTSNRLDWQESTALGATIEMKKSW